MDKKDEINNRKFNILLGLTGSVACIKLNELIDSFKKTQISFDLCIICTQNAQKFLNLDDYNQINDLNERLNYLKQDTNHPKATTTTPPPKIFTFKDDDEWSTWRKRDDPILHIELRRWADVFVIAPLDANTLAKLANGICDNLITCVARAWDLNNKNDRKKSILFAPAMNTHMYEHKLTRKQIDILVNEFGYYEVKSIEKKLMCGDIGYGAMAEVNTIVNATMEMMLKSNR